MDPGAAIAIMEVFVWAGGIFFLLWLDRRNLNKAKAESARRKELEAKAPHKPSPAMVPTATQSSATKS
ncbi:hypothetical protein [Roseospira navarrensis]|uniref:Uncharacterized protein n=1 Tax=Roseospira navarrensis TaxID=140058 RepID=A0A7X2D699_9PROT|nr:hypothetical protein [Roseospira navarrensis]MQX38512.1 hypothetical protein [Roseospira navarrensis]